jgi:pimeloyl-ACP methyl ester carboxylesterase
MFAAYSRQVDRRIFTRINSWLGKRNYRTNPGELEKFTNECKRSTLGEFLNVPRSSNVEIAKASSYPPVYNFRFPSPLPSGYPANDVVCGEVHPRHRLSAPAVIFLSGWLVNGADFSRMADWVGRSGRNLWVTDMPYHSRRTPKDTRPGELSLTGDMVRSLSGIRQIAVDTRVLITVLKELGVTDIALLGASLGGWVGALLAGVEPSLSQLVLVTPAIRADKVLFASPFFTFLRKGIGAADGMELFANLRHLFLPRDVKPVISPENIHLIGAHEDPIASPADIAELSQCWGCKREILPGGHVTLYLTPRFWRRVFTLLHVPA